MIKIIFSDMDGTLLNSEKKISDKTARAIFNLTKRGVYVTLSTGRGVAEIADYKDTLGFINYGILVSGGYVYDFADKKTITTHPLTEDLVLQLIDAADAEKAMKHILTVNESIMSRADINHIEDFHMEIYKDMYERNTIDCTDFKKFVRDNPGKIMKFNMYHRSPEARQRTLDKFKNAPITFSYAEETSLEASPKNISKASGLIELCELLKIDISETVAVGDAQNDTEILQTAGFSVAMGNATPEIKKIADFITLDNDSDGVAAAIEKFFCQRFSRQKTAIFSITSGK